MVTVIVLNLKAPSDVLYGQLLKKPMAVFVFLWVKVLREPR